MELNHEHVNERYHTVPTFIYGLPHRDANDSNRELNHGPSPCDEHMIMIVNTRIDESRAGASDPIDDGYAGWRESPCTHECPVTPLRTATPLDPTPDPPCHMHTAHVAPPHRSARRLNSKSEPRRSIIAPSQVPRCTQPERFGLRHEPSLPMHTPHATPLPPCKSTSCHKHLAENVPLVRGPFARTASRCAWA